MTLKESWFKTIKRTIKLAKNAGFCYGVKRAVDTTKKIKQENPNKTVSVLGELIHNSHVTSELENLGIKTDKQAVICLAREIDFYRNKLRSLEGQTRARANAAMSVMPKEATEPHALILERIPQNMRDRISCIEHAADGSVTIYFDVEEKKEN